MNISWDDVLFFQKRYKFGRTNRKGRILTKGGESVDFASMKDGEERRKIVAYHLALYHICARIHPVFGEEAQEHDDRVIFDKAMPIIKDIEETIRKNATNDNKLIMTNEQISEVIERNKQYKHASEIVNRAMNSICLKSICDMVLDRDVNIQQEGMSCLDMLPHGEKKVDIDLGKQF